MYRTLDQCMYGLKDRGTGKLHRKSTRIMTNSDHIAQFMMKRCDKQHEHEHIIGHVKTEDGWKLRSKCAQEYPREFVRAILHGLQEDARARGISQATHCAHSRGTEN